MAKIELHCYHADCAGEVTILLLDEKPGAGTTGKLKRIECYCKKNHLNIIEIPANLYVQPHVLGGDIVRYRSGVAVAQGRDPFGGGSTAAGASSDE